MNEQAISIIQRIKDKLTGNDFEERLNVFDQVFYILKQVDRLISEAISNENLAQIYIGWYYL